MALERTTGDGGFPRPLTPDDRFYRAIRPSYIYEDGRISRAAFAKSTGNEKMSVDWAELSTPQETYDRWPQWGEGRAVAEVTAQALWMNQQMIEYAPTPDNPAHSEVADRPDRTIGKDKILSNLARAAVLLPFPSNA